MWYRPLSACACCYYILKACATFDRKCRCSWPYGTWSIPYPCLACNLGLQASLITLRKSVQSHDTSSFVSLLGLSNRHKKSCAILKQIIEPSVSFLNPASSNILKQASLKGRYAPLTADACACVAELPIIKTTSLHHLPQRERLQHSLRHNVGVSWI